jgi:hypothetical protein
MSWMAQLNSSRSNYCALALLALSVFAPSTIAASLVAHWKLNESGAPYANFSSNGIALNHDAATTPPLAVPGHDGYAAQLRWQNPPGVATRLYASGGKLQTDSFGFSFWFNPRFLAPFENLIAREMPFNNTVPAYARLSWQVLISGDDGSSAAPLELVVRGNNRAQAIFSAA